MDPLHQVIAAVKASDAKTLARLLREHPGLAGARDDTGDSILLLSIYRNQPAVRNVILEHRPALNVFEAASLGDLAAVRSHIGRFPELVRAYSHDGFTALHLASYFGHADVAAFLVDSGSDVNAVSTNIPLAPHAAPLHCAASGRHLPVAKLLLDRGADVNARQDGGYTPLHLAAAAGDMPLVEELLRRGADRYLKSDDHHTPADLARKGGFTAVEGLL